MHPDERDVDALVAAFTAWVETRDDVVGAALIGSHARSEARAGSDVDLLIVTTAPRRYLEDHEWVTAFGSPEEIALEEWGAVTSLRVRFQRGPEVELGVTSPEWLGTDPVDPGTARVVRDGFRVLWDPDGSLCRLSATVRQ
jgi:predicted nucleotidyltransferase